MGFRACFASFSLTIFSVTAAFAQSKTAAPSAPVVQPGAPGKPTKTLKPAAAVPVPAVSEADASFMQGMIHHHAQAVEMVELLRTRAESRELRTLGERIAISQTDEIQYMKDWLTERGKPVAAHDHSAHAGHGAAASMMPGMLTSEQME